MATTHTLATSPLEIVPGDVVRMRLDQRKGTTVERVSYGPRCGNVHVNNRECYDLAATVYITRG